MPTETAPSSESTTLLNSLMSSTCSTTSNSCSINVTSSDHLIHSNGSSYTANMAHVTDQCSQTISNSIGSLSDGGANSGLVSADFHVLEYTECCADITGSRPGINQHTSTCNLCWYHTHDSGSCFLIMNQYNLLWKGEYSPF